MENKEKNKKYLTAGFIGFFCILLVALVTIFRSNLSKKENLIGNEINLKDSNQKISSVEEKSIEAKDLMNKIIQKDKVVILDVRSEVKYKKEHLADSMNIPLDNLQKMASSLQKDATYIILDDDYAQSSILAIQMLAESKILNAFYLKGGFASWKAQYNPTISSGDPNSFVDQSKVKYIKSPELKEMMTQDPKLLIIDLRDSGSFQAGHINGATNIFLENLEKEKTKISLGQRIALYDNDGLWAFMGAVRLYDMGYFNVLTLSDGLDGWKNNKFEVVK